MKRGLTIAGMVLALHSLGVAGTFTAATSFEQEEGYQLGALNGQGGWTVATDQPNGVAEIVRDEPNGQYSVRLSNPYVSLPVTFSLARFLPSHPIHQSAYVVGMKWAPESGNLKSTAGWALLGDNGFFYRANGTLYADWREMGYFFPTWSRSTGSTASSILGDYLRWTEFKSAVVFNHVYSPAEVVSWWSNSIANSSGFFEINMEPHPTTYTGTNSAWQIEVTVQPGASVLVDDVSLTATSELLPDFPHYPSLGIRVSDVEICWDSRTNVVYRLQYRLSEDTGWQDATGPMPGTGSRMCVKEPVTDPHRLYRVEASLGN